MQPFHVSLHARTQTDAPEKWFDIDGRRIARLMIEPTQLTAPLAISFHDALAAIAELPRMYIEADGSWVWVSSHDHESWQLDGVLYDGGTHLQYVEMKGTCTAAAFDAFVSLLRRPSASFVVQWMRQAVYVTEQEFRRFQFGS